MPRNIAMTDQDDCDFLFRASLSATSNVSVQSLQSWWNQWDDACDRLYKGFKLTRSYGDDFGSVKRRLDVLYCASPNFHSLPTTMPGSFQGIGVPCARYQSLQDDGIMSYDLQEAKTKNFLSVSSI